MITKTQYLKTFLALMSEKSFVKAARVLHMTQPGVSQHLRHLEEFYGLSLITRKGKLFQPTDAGIRLKNYAEKLFKEHDRFKETLGNDIPTEGLCKISAPGSFALFLYSFLLDLNKSYSDLKFHFTVAPNTSVIQAIRDESIDLGFVSIKTIDPDLIATKITQEKLLLVAPKNARVESYEDIKKLGIITHPDGYQYAHRILTENYPKEFRSLDEITFRGYINQNNRILDPVAEGLGFSVVPEFTLHHYPRKNEVKIIKLKKAIIDDVVMLTKARSHLPKRYEFVLEKLRTQLGKYSLQTHLN